MKTYENSDFNRKALVASEAYLEGMKTGVRADKRLYPAVVRSLPRRNEN